MGIQDGINFIYFETKYHNYNRGCKIMYLKRVELKNFRNYSSLTISLNIIVYSMVVHMQVDVKVLRP